MQTTTAWLFEAPVAHEVAATGHAEFEATRSPVRTDFEAAVRSNNWQTAFLKLNGLNMSEMLGALDGLTPLKLGQLWAERIPFQGMVNMPRISYARDVVVNRMLPAIVVGDLQQTGQVADAANFLALDLAPVARAVNPAALPNISLILQECSCYGITDKSHVAYVLASAHHESGVGATMTEIADGRAYDPPSARATALGNTAAGDGPRYKGRGFVQLTGRRNYTTYTAFLRRTRGLTVDLVATPTRATDPAIAAMIIAHGMSNGIFTGRRLAQFGRDCAYDFVAARQIVNGHDRAAPIAAIARRYRTALR